MILTFTSAINIHASGIVYELHELDEKNYMVKWKVGEHSCDTKHKKSEFDWLVKKGKYTILNENKPTNEGEN